MVKKGASNLPHIFPHICILTQKECRIATSVPRNTSFPTIIFYAKKNEKKRYTPCGNPPVMSASSLSFHNGFGSIKCITLVEYYTYSETSAFGAVTLSINARKSA